MPLFLKLAARPSIVVAIAIFACSILACAQDIAVVVTNGKTGARLSNERVLVFEFDGKPPQHEFSVELYTDSKGVAILHVADIRHKKLQLWVDKRTQCVADPNHVAFDVAEIHKSGIKGPNNCAGFLDDAFIVPNAIEIFARRATWREKMDW